MKRNKLEKLLSNPSVIVVIVPAVAFLMAYVYKIGFFFYFKIPLSFLIVSARDVSIMAALIIVCLLILLSFDAVLSAIVLDPFFRKYEKDSVMTEQQYDLYCSFVAFFLLDIALFVLGIFWPILIITSLPLIIIPIQFIVRHKKYNPEVRAVSFQKKENHYYCPSIVFTILGMRTTAVIFFVSSIVLFTTVFGARMASIKTTFYGIDDRNDIVGIIINDDSIIAKRIDDTSLKETIIVKMNDTSVIREIKSEGFYSLVHELNNDGFMFRSNLFQSKKTLKDEETTNEILVLDNTDEEMAN